MSPVTGNAGHDGDLESPFLREEPFTAERNDAWSARLAALEAESPFVTAHRTAPRGYAEALYQTAPDIRPADALVLDKDAKDYFDTFPQLGDLSIQRATVLTPSNFESLLDHLLASTRKNFVIDAHGSPAGLSMHLASGTTVSPTKQSLFLLRGIEYVRALMRLADESDTIWERASGADLYRWQRIVDVMHSKTWRTMAGPTWPPSSPRVSDVDAAKSLVQSRLTALANALFPGAAADKQARVDRLVQRMLQVQAKGIREVQFRACNIGKDLVTLHEFRKFLGADHLCAPDVRTGIGVVVPRIDRAGVDALAKRRLTQLYELPSGRFAIFIDISGSTFDAACAAESQAAVEEWLASHVMADSRYRRGTLPIHFLQTRPLSFSLDPDYAAHIQCRSSLWEGAVRAHELEEEEAQDGEDQSGPDAFEVDIESEVEQAWARGQEYELAEAAADSALVEAALQYDTPPMTQVISDAVDQKNWPRVLELAMQVGWHDENQLSNLLFFSRHPELDRRKLNPQQSSQDRKLADEWNQILLKEVRPAIQKAAEDSTLEVSGRLVAERDPELSGTKGEQFKSLVAWAAKEVDMDPGFLAAVLLAEVGSASPYLRTGEVSSFFTGTDDFFAQRAQLRANVPAFAQVHFDERKKTTNINEHGREVTTIPYRTGKDAALATAVYLKWAEIKLRRAMQKNGRDFDTLPVATRFVLVRVAMAAGHGGISPDGELIRFKKKGDTGAGRLVGVARSVERVLKGEDILVRNWEPRKDPTNDSHITHRNATILASQALHLGDWFFRSTALGIQPELE